MILSTDWTGVWGADQPGNLQYDINGNQVTLTFPKVISVASIVNNITNTNLLPVFIRPSTYRYSSLIVMNSASTIYGGIQIGPDGLLIIGKDLTQTAFDGRFNTGFVSQSIIYTL